MGLLLQAGEVAGEGGSHKGGLQFKLLYKTNPKHLFLFQKTKARAKSEECSKLETSCLCVEEEEKPPTDIT